MGMDAVGMEETAETENNAYFASLGPSTVIFHQPRYII